MRELRALLGVLRDGSGEVALAPQPRLGDLSALVTTVRASGVDVGVSITGPVGDLPVHVDLAGYRVVQEGLTNVVKHAPGAVTGVTIEVGPMDATIGVTNGPSAGRAVPADGLGVGLIGLQERRRAPRWHGAGRPASDGGFELEARLPLRAGR